MRVLRLFVTNNLDIPLNWILVDNETKTESGTSTWDELSVFDNVSLEIYLDAQCCSILHTNVKGIATKRLSEELVLGMLEDSIVDDIEEIKPIILRIEDDTAYVAIFNKAFYESLLYKIVSIGKPIRFLQSFVYSTIFDEDEWTLFLNNDQQFVRTSKYEYFLVDDSTPLPLIIKNMLSENKPKSIRLYSEDTELSEFITKEYQIPCKIESQVDFGIPIWNFYNQKSTHFKIKLDKITKKNLYNLLKVFRTFSIALILFWILDIVVVSCSIHNTESDLKNSFEKTYPIKSFTSSTIKEINDKVDNLKHSKGMYSRKDAITLFSSFLNVVPSVGNNSIVQISYKNNILEIFLNSNFDTSQFISYKNILSTQRIKTTIEDYKTYMSKEKSDQSSKNPDANNSQSIDAAWVVTLQPSLMFELRDKS
ncbi:MAG: type II secretion system protein GspL [Neisseriaceae bacterium]